MTIYLKRSTDVGAPSLTNSAGSLITLLDYLFVTTMSWTKPYTGTNKAAYKQPSGTNQFYLRVDDTGTTNASVVGYETMSDVDTGTGPFPTAAQVSGGLYWPKSSSGSAAPWIFLSNGKIGYLFVKYNGTNWLCVGFGDFSTYKTSDAYHTLIIGETSAPSSTTVFSNLATSITSANTGHYVARSYTQIGSAINVGKFSNYILAAAVSNLGAGGCTYPAPVDGGLHLAPVWISETTSGVGARGLLPGIWSPMHNRPLTHGDTFSGTGSLSSRNFEAVDLGSAVYQVFIETSDTWGGF